MSGQGIKPNYLKPGTVVGAYQVEEQIGGGGFGFVYQVKRDGKVFALKIGQSRLSVLEPDERAATVERLGREVTALMSLHHANIVRVHSFDRWPDLEGGFPYLVMDYVDGTPLQEWRVDARPSLARVVAVFEKVADALQHMHQVGIIHRDLKSENVIVRVDGEPFIVDFGIARPLVAYDVTRAAGVGTLSHLAPEYATFLDSAEARKRSPFEWKPSTDLYAFGYVLYEALTCEPPVPRFTEAGAREEFELMNAIKNAVPRRPRELAPRIPQVLDDLVMQLLEKDPQKRPQVAGEVANRLREARESGERASDSVWVNPLDIVGGEPGGPVGEAAGRKPPPVRDDDEVQPLDATGEPKEARAQVADAGTPPRVRPGPPAAMPPAPPRAGAAVSLPTAARSPAYVAGDEVQPQPRSSAPDGWGRHSQIMKRVAAEWEAALPKPRRWPFAVAGAAGALLLLALLVATHGPGEPPRPQTLLSTVEGGARPSATALPPQAEAKAADPAAGAPPAADDGGQSTQRQSEVVPPGNGSDARSIDQGLARKKWRPKVRPGGRLVSRPPGRVEESSGLLRSRPLGSEPQGLQRSRQIGSPNSAPVTTRTRGVAFGSHIQARLITNLDTRTIAHGPVEALLNVPHVARGQVLLPTRTMAYGTATESGGRFTIRFTRLRLPDDTEVAFEGIALARDDGKPGLAASGRIGHEPKRGEGLGTKVAKGTGNILLDTVTGGIGQNVARSAGQAALNQEESPPVSGDWAILLESGIVFDIFVEKSF